MTNFTQLFGIKPTQCQKTCILFPFLTRTIKDVLGERNWYHGKRFSCAQMESATIIHTRVGAANVGDAVLYLKETSARRVILAGACGAVSRSAGFKLGDLVTFSKAYNFESFSQLLSPTFKGLKAVPANLTMLAQFVESTRSHKVSVVTAATFGSILLEENYINRLQRLRITAIDMEGSAFFAAAKHNNIDALAVCFISDILKYRPIFSSRSEKERILLNNAQKNLTLTLLDFTKNLSPH